MRRRVSDALRARPRLREYHWFFLIVGLYLLIAASAHINRVLPSTHWFEVRAIAIADTVRGVSPAMQVDRTIRRPFQADWIVTVMRQNVSGNGFTTHCTARGGNDYRPSAQLPDNLTLDWWTWPLRCNMPPGRYKVKTLWVLDLPDNVTKRVRAVSNEFEVRQN